MKCPHCGSKKHNVYRTRRLETSVYRERKCKKCKKVFETDELVIPDGEVHHDVPIGVKPRL